MMKNITILFHDVVENNNWDSSGFPGIVESRYKLNLQDFRKYLEVIENTKKWEVKTYKDLTLKNNSIMLAFDDGGISFYSLIMKELQEFNYKGHFFITTNFIDKKEFLNKKQIIEINKNGHIIGAHSHTHPRVISSLSYSEILSEWRISKNILEDIIEEEVETASVPGGFYSKKVADAAIEAGFKFLFTSEPEKKIKNYKQLYLIPRFTVFDYHTPEYVGLLTSDSFYAPFKEYLWWNSKKIMKNSLGPVYFIVRKSLIKK